MNSLGWAIIFKMGCWCSKETIIIGGTKYVVRERIAQGGFSLIDLVENATTKRKYALKRITCHSIEDQKIAMREVELTRSIKHPNVVEIIDFELKGDADIVINTISHVYILFPFFKNGSLLDHLNMRAKTKDHMAESQVLQIFVGICEGLKALHEAKPEPLAHRDLKTANICLSDSMEPILVDLGSCTEAREQICGQHEAQRLQDQAEERCSIVYRALELFNVQSYYMIDERTDIWSLGCCLYAICFFKCPYDIIYEKGDSVALAVLSGNVDFPTDSPYSEVHYFLILFNFFLLSQTQFQKPFIASK
ncbi:serine/threonine-protein kinase 16-like [Sitodiplosis mosellana]|uniref:serine/threonine-protein kinase 16-like n=1 Tax=Sitodiplosis mosellana TaxID=263140 RepID=UPI0024446EC7|nr:serine/threonine-protein kinase 16-like [Sitodiplosis mosellana]